MCSNVNGYSNNQMMTEILLVKIDCPEGSLGKLFFRILGKSLGQHEGLSQTPQVSV